MYLFIPVACSVTIMTRGLLKNGQFSSGYVCNSSSYIYTIYIYIIVIGQRNFVNSIAFIIILISDIVIKIWL